MANKNFNEEENFEREAFCTKEEYIDLYSLEDESKEEQDKKYQEYLTEVGKTEEEIKELNGIKEEKKLRAEIKEKKSLIAEKKSLIAEEKKSLAEKKSLLEEKKIAKKEKKKKEIEELNKEEAKEYTEEERKNLFSLWFETEYEKLNPLRKWPGDPNLDLFWCYDDYKKNGKLTREGHSELAKKKWAIEKENILLAMEEYESQEFINQEFEKHLFRQQNQNRKFWYYQENKGLQLDAKKCREFILGLGYCNILAGKDGVKKLVKIKGFVCKEATKTDIINEIANFLDEKYPAESSKVYEKILGKVVAEIISNLPQKEENFCRDSRKRAYFPFQNGVVIVEKGRIFLDEKFKGLFWENQTKKRNANLDNQELRGKFYGFIQNISENGKRLDNIMTGLGYLCHTYQAVEDMRAVIITESTPPGEDSQGGSGKSLLLEAIKKFREIATIDGKGLTRNRMADKFLYQTVKLSTNILVFDDLLKTFDFELLFSRITNGITIEHKGEQAITIDAIDSPKIAITSNFGISGTDSSSRRRRFDVEIFKYYNHEHRPNQDFGVFWGDDWTEEDWAAFDLFIFKCVEKYLDKGLIFNNTKNLEEKTVAITLGTSVVDFVQEQVETYLEKEKEGEQMLPFRSIEIEEKARDAKTTTNVFVRRMNLAFEKLGFKVITKRQAGKDEITGKFYTTYTLVKK